MKRLFACMAILLAGAAQAEGQFRDRLSRIDRIDRAATRTVTPSRQAERPETARRDPAPELLTARVEGDDRLTSDPRLIRARDGFPARRNEILALDLSDAARMAAIDAGMRIISEQVLADDVTRLSRIEGTPPFDTGAMLDLLRTADPGGVFDFNHAFAASAPAPQVGASPRAPDPASEGQPRLGMIDGGAPASHPGLAGVSLRQRAFPAGRQVASSDHGVAVAGLLAYGMAQPFELLVADVLGESGSGWASADGLAAGLVWMTAESVAVVNVSLAGPPNAVVERMVARHLVAGGEIVAAVGNGGPFSGAIYPAAYPGVIGVTASDAKGRIWPIASTGEHVDLAARGVDVPVLTLVGSDVMSGTSWSAPVVTAALCRNACGRGEEDAASRASRLASLRQMPTLAATLSKP